MAFIASGVGAWRSTIAWSRSSFPPKWYWIADALRCPAKAWISRIGTSMPCRANRCSAARSNFSRVAVASRLTATSSQGARLLECSDAGVVVAEHVAQDLLAVLARLGGLGRHRQLAA